MHTADVFLCIFTTVGSPQLHWQFLQFNSSNFCCFYLVSAATYLSEEGLGLSRNGNRKWEWQVGVSATREAGHETLFSAHQEKGEGRRMRNEVNQYSIPPSLFIKIKNYIKPLIVHHAFFIIQNRILSRTISLQYLLRHETLNYIIIIYSNSQLY